MKPTITGTIEKIEFVAPFTGAWIETVVFILNFVSSSVAPFTGAWIETHFINFVADARDVAPFTGAWIET